MKAEDTVMSKKEIALTTNCVLEEEQVDFMQYVRGVTEKEKDVAEAQAEISFPLGMKVVVEWTENNIAFYNDSYTDLWQDKLKEWGIG